MFSQTHLTLEAFRTRFHPLGNIRRYGLFRKVLRAVDVPIWARVPGLNWKIRGRLIRHATVFILPGSGEPGIAALFRAIALEIGIHSFWDVGANIGYYTWLVKAIAPSAEVRMFEPETDNLFLVRQTLQSAQQTDITIRAVAVCDRSGQSTFITDDICGSTGTLEQSAATFCQQQWGLPGRVALVQTVSLDDERILTGPVDLLKIDVEGAEEAVICGARNMIASDQPIIIFECFHESRSIIEILCALDYWVGDAEQINEPIQNGTTNFVAIPRRLAENLGQLKASWVRQMADLSGRSWLFFIC